MGTIKKTEKLEHLGIVEIKGGDSAEFLQGQMTQDIYSIEDSKASVTSILNPQGRIISTAFVFKWGESFILILNNEVRGKLIAWLSRFILRSKVEITQSDDSIFGLNQEHVKTISKKKDRNISVIIISGHADTPIVVQAVQCGAEDFIVKPFGPDRLLGSLERLITLVLPEEGGERSGEGAP